VKYNSRESNARTTGIKIEPHERWNAKTKTIEGSEIKTLTIREFETELNDIFSKLRGKGQHTTAKLLMEYIAGKRQFVQDVPNLIGAIDSYIENQRIELENGGITAITFRRYEVRRQNTIEFLEAIYKVSNLPITDLKPIIGTEYASFLRNRKKLGVSTVNKDVGFFKAVLSYSVLHEWTHHNVLSHWKRSRVKTEIFYLTKNEVDTIKNLTITDNTLDKVRWIFVFACYTGFSYKDLKALKTEHIATENENGLYLRKKREKSGVLSIVPLVKTSLEILARYHDHATETGLLLPCLSLDKYNVYLKSLQSYASIGRIKITSKLARNTFSTVLLNQMVMPDLIIKSTGHSNTDTLMNHYAVAYEATTLSTIKQALENIERSSQIANI
jgi:integrase